uniref:3'-5' exonuclease domain-containing protein n=1 Tax=Rhabditophanes sp. KR3021 TaxID=114890 RepID=A0AC35TJ08_9BILA
MNWKAYDLPDEIEYEDEYEWESNFEDYELVENIPGNVFGCDLECNQNKDFCDYTYETPSETDEVELIPKKNIIEQVLIITADFYDYYNTQVAKLIVKQCNKEELLNLVIEQYTFKYAYWANRSVITEWEHNNCLLKKEVAKALFLKTIKPSSILIGYGLISALTDLGIVHHNVLELCPDEMCKIKDKDTTPEYWRKLTRLHLADLSNVERGNAYWKKKATLKLLEYYLNRKYYPQKRKLLQVCNPLQYSKELIHLAHTRKYKKENRF